MSHWNGSNSYNSRQYRESENWNNDQGNQHPSQSNYSNQHRQNNHYVSFNQFIAHMQTDEGPSSNSYDQSQTYGANSAPSTSQEVGSYGNVDNSAGTSQSYNVSNSKLTPTATEFVPKNAHAQYTPAVGASAVNAFETDHRSSSRNRRPNNREEKKFDRHRKPNKNRDSDARKTFYNSNSSQDIRNNANRNKNWFSTQRGRTEWNQPEDENSVNNYHQYKPKQSPKYKPVSNQELTQRERLSEQLDRGTLECLVCCELLKQMESVWSCSNCYNIQHLKCIKKWAVSSIVEGKWRCPACQNTNIDIPMEYRCMCGAVRNPDFLRGSAGAHTCGQQCSRVRSCKHPCPLQCHPGPCPPCQATVRKACNCGAEHRIITCSNKQPQICTRTCNKKLNCNVHRCLQTCHEGPCAECDQFVTQVCYCPGGNTHQVKCASDTSSSLNWSCGSECGRVLSCGAHVCRQQCHPPPCAPCQLLPSLVALCPCGQTQIKDGQRKSCTDPIPLCGKLCTKRLECGPNGDNHFCKVECHEGPCPTCPDKTTLPCQCGHTVREILCANLPQEINNIFCQKKCNKKLSCDRHRCRALCCTDSTHRCRLQCGRTLHCGTHRCERTCHTGYCGICMYTSFEELTCECGAEIIYPPIHCGTRPPLCNNECVRERPCGHTPLHSCHSGECPPCVVLTSKKCHGQHEERKAIPCSLEGFSCGLPCGKPLPCGKHQCIKTCHKGPCDSEVCKQPCTVEREWCSHPCGAPCHNGPCPTNTPCRRPVTATCPCRRRTLQRPCAENQRELNKIMSALAATKIQEGESVDLADMTRAGSNLKTLECDDECRVEARTRQMALALQIKNPDISSKLAPRYSEHVRQWATRDQVFAQNIHDKLTDLVHLAKKSKQKTRSHSFPSMNRQKRQFIHEMCEHFGCESVAYDAEPNRNVVATADKEKSWLPAMSVLEVLSREAGKRRVPGPMLRNDVQQSQPTSLPQTSSTTAKSTSGWATLTPTNAWATRSKQQAEPETKPPVIDYFDYPPDN